MAIATVNPATGEQIREFAALTADQLEQKVRLAAETFPVYRRTSFADRARLLHRTADILEAEASELAELATLEMGKTHAAAIAEVKKSAAGCRWYADHGAEMLADESWPVDGARVFTRYEPLGPVLAVMPWNFPYWQVFRFAAPALMAGNVGLLKHASSVPQVALKIEEVLHRAGFAEGVFQTLLIPSSAVEGLIGDDRVRAVTLTGSEPAGRQVGAAAGQNIKTSVLELGGSDAFIVLPSADLDKAVQAGVQSRTLNNGQSCINAKRFILHADIADEFLSRFVERMAGLTIGDPMAADTDLGPLSSAAALDEVHQQVTATVEAGATLLTGGKPLGGPGNYYPATVLTDIPEGSPGHVEEIFGPVAVVWRAADIDEAIRIANDSTLGLGGSAWTTDPAEQERIVSEVDTGMMTINGFTQSTPEVPFGGTKNSGYGRELATFGQRSFTNPKTVWIS
ncbi:NAD-dependent succinate-semialdehyde dehydrogenase [Pseudonocardiaceae bacterium YIM PH 21723]|nr:NAD-dependent succinate-semialdehyde dehydrogenase [Pseudonocardiaceae bacterium YIM PH 21723]